MSRILALTPPARSIDPRGQRFGAGVSAVICVGCRLYVLRWFVPALFARLFRRADRLVGVAIPTPISYSDR